MTAALSEPPPPKPLDLELTPEAPKPEATNVEAPKEEPKPDVAKAAADLAKAVSEPPKKPASEPPKAEAKTVEAPVAEKRSAEKLGPPTPLEAIAPPPKTEPMPKAPAPPPAPAAPPALEPEAIVEHAPNTAPMPMPGPVPAPAVDPPRPSTSVKPSAPKVDAPSAITPLAAYEALARSSRLSDLVAVTKEVVGEAARTRRGGPGFGIKVTAAADDVKLDREGADTPFGNALDVLGKGPEDAAERALAAALWAHAVAESPRGTADDEDVLAGDILWLATHTAFDATSLIDRALGDDSDSLWHAIAERVKRIDQGKGGALSRGEAIVGAAALSAAKSPRGGTLATQVKDPILVRLLSDATEPALGEVRLEGELVPAPRGPIVTALLAFSGILFVVHAVRLLARLALAYRRPAELSLTNDAVRVKTKTLMLGRTLREKEHVIVRAGLVRVVREVRYPRLAFYAGLLALAFGSYIGVRAFVDGVRSASPSLLLIGLVIVLIGIAADFVLGSLVPGSRGKVRLAFVPRSGPIVCVGDVDAKRADDAITRTLRK